MYGLLPTSTTSAANTPGASVTTSSVIRRTGWRMRINAPSLRGEARIEAAIWHPEPHLPTCRDEKHARKMHPLGAPKSIGSMGLANGAAKSSPFIRSESKGYQQAIRGALLFTSGWSGDRCSERPAGQTRSLSSGSVQSLSSAAKSSDAGDGAPGSLSSAGQTWPGSLASASASGWAPPPYSLITVSSTRVGAPPVGRKPPPPPQGAPWWNIELIPSNSSAPPATPAAVCSAPLRKPPEPPLC